MIIIVEKVKSADSKFEVHELKLEFDDRDVNQVQLVTFIKKVEAQCEDFGFSIPSGFGELKFSDLGKKFPELGFGNQSRIEAHYKVKNSEYNLSLIQIRHNLCNIILNYFKEKQTDLAYDLLNLCYEQELLTLVHANKLIEAIQTDSNYTSSKIYKMLKRIITANTLNSRSGEIKNEFKPKVDDPDIENSHDQRVQRVKDLFFPTTWQEWPEDKQMLQHFFTQNGLENDEDLQKLAPIVFNFKLTGAIDSAHLLTAAESGNSELLKLALDYNANINFSNTLNWSSDFAEYDLYLIKGFYKPQGKDVGKDVGYFMKKKVVMLTNQNTAVFVIENKVCEYVQGIQRGDIYSSDFDYPTLYDFSKSQKESIIRESLFKRNAQLAGDEAYETAFMRAIRKGKTEIIKILMQYPDLKYTYRLRQDTRSALAQAIHYKQEAVLDILTKNPKIKIDEEKDSKGQPLLLQVIQLGYLRVVENLLWRGVSVCLAGPGGLTPLMVAAENLHIKILTTLLNVWHAQVNDTDLENNTALIKICETQTGSLVSKGEIIKILIESKANVEHTNAKGKTALDKAQLYNPSLYPLLSSTSGAIPTSTFFQSPTSSPAPLETKQKRPAQSPHGAVLFNPKLVQNIRNGRLLQAVKEGKLNNVETELKSGANINCFDGEGTPLMIALKHGYSEIVDRLLEELDFDPNQSNAYGVTALMAATECGNLGIVEALLEEDTLNPNQCDVMDNTALMIAIEKNQTRKIKEALLMHEKADLNTANREGNTPLMLAIHCRDLDTAKMLLLFGVNPDPARINRNGDSVFTLARELSDHRFINLLHQYSRNQEISSIKNDSINSFNP